MRSASHRLRRGERGITVIATVSSRDGIKHRYAGNSYCPLWIVGATNVDERRTYRVSCAGPGVASASSQIRLTFSPTRQHSPLPPRQTPRPQALSRAHLALFVHTARRSAPRPAPRPRRPLVGPRRRSRSRSRLALFPVRSEMRGRECDREAAASPHSHTVLSDPPDNVKWPNESSVVRSLPTWGLFTASPVCCVVNDTLSSVPPPPPPPLVFSLAFPHTHR